MNGVLIEICEIRPFLCELAEEKQGNLTIHTIDILSKI